MMPLGRKPVPQAVQPERDAADLNRIGLAKQEQWQNRVPFSQLKMSQDELEGLMRVLPQLTQVLADVRKGVRTRWNFCDVIEFDTNSEPATGNGFHLNVSKLTGGYPLDSVTIDDVGGAGTTMRATINGKGRFRVDQGDVFDNGEIWDAHFFVGTGAAGTARLFITAYIPGIGGNRGF